MAKAADVYFGVDPWKITETGFDPGYARVSESVFSLGNESMGVRGFFEEGGSTDSLRGCYHNGVYDLEQLSRSYKGIVDKTHFMIPSADYLGVRLVLDGEVLDLGRSRFRDFRRELDMAAGTLTRSFVWQAENGKELRVTFLRFLDMVHRERAYQRITLKPLNFSGELSFATGVTFQVTHAGRSRCFWGQTRLAGDGKRLCAQSETVGSHQQLFAGILIDLPEGQITEAEKTVSVRTVLPLVQGQETRVDKRAVLIFDGTEGETLWDRGQRALRDTEAVTLDQALAAQRAYWDGYWSLSDIRLHPAGEDPETLRAVEAEQQGVRFCSFQLAQTYNGGSMRHNIGAKGLTGEAYNGHAFWDTEACCLPFYLFTNPEAARDLLLFRYNTLPNALERAKMLDCRGACYPIATLNGDEACNLWQHASLQLQPGTAVAYGIWHYVHVTGDRDFLWQYGAEMLLQIARFQESRVERSSKTGKFGFYGVMGPDEFHMMVNNNAYTNYMGMRTLRYAGAVLREMEECLPERYRALAEKTALTETERTRWQEIADNMALPQEPSGLFEQHDGYFDLPHTDISAIPASQFPLYDHWSYDRIYRSDMIKQPDVLMFLYLYNTSFPEAVKRVNYEFYEPRTIHESSLSPAIHSILAAELGKMDDAVRFFGYATRLDLDNYNRNTREGLHITSIAMAWANIVYGFAGLRSDGDLLRFAPRMPERWRELTFSLTCRGTVIRVRMTRTGTTFHKVQGPDVPMLICGRQYTLGREDLTVENAG